MMALQSPLSNQDKVHWLRLKLLEILNRRHDQAWFAENEHDIRKVMYAASFEIELIRLVVLALEVCIKHYRWHKLYEDWERIAQKALLTSMPLRESPQHRHWKARLYVRWGEILMLTGEHGMALTAANIALAEGESLLDETIQLEALVLLLSIQPLRASHEIKPEHIEYALTLAESRRVRSSELRSRLYRALAMLFTHRNEFELSQKYARIAYRLCRKMRDKQSKIDMMVVKAFTARYRSNLRHAEKRLLALKPHITETIAPGQYARIYHELGIISLYQDQPHQATESIHIAIRVFEKLDMSAHLAMSHQSMGLAYIEQKHFQDAARHLHKARRLWLQQRNPFGQTQLRVAEAYYALQRKHLCSAMVLLAGASTTLEKVTDIGMKAGLAWEIDDMARKIGDAWNAQKGGA
jgi:tetratricopeptide (TPR) repeat protein